MKKLLIIAMFPVVGFCQSSYTMQDANVIIAEGSDFNVISSIAISPSKVIEGSDFTVLISNLPMPNSGISTSVEYVDEELVSINVFPNPFSELIYLDMELDKSENLNYQIFNLSGLKVFQMRDENVFGNSRKTIDTNTLATGHYILIVSNDTDRILSKIRMVKVK